jgi:hypothetical protein
MNRFHGRDHGQRSDLERVCEAPIRGAWRRCKNPPLVNEPFCALHTYEASKPTTKAVSGYEWHPLRDGAGRPYFWFQLRTESATRRAWYLNRPGDTLSEAERSEVRRALGEDVLKKAT